MVCRRWLFALLLCAGARADEDDAREHARRGQQAYAAARFADALVEYAAAYDARPQPDLLYALGQCHRRLGNWDAALFFYRGFLVEAPDSPDRADVERLIAEAQAAKAAQAAVASARPLLPTETPVYRKRWFWWTAAAVVVAGATVAALLAAFAGPTHLPADSLGTIDAR